MKNKEKLSLLISRKLKSQQRAEGVTQAREHLLPPNSETLNSNPSNASPTKK
jgi:hypothetical protein